MKFDIFVKTDNEYNLIKNFEKDSVLQLLFLKKAIYKVCQQFQKKMFKIW